VREPAAVIAACSTRRASSKTAYLPETHEHVKRSIFAQECTRSILNCEIQSCTVSGFDFSSFEDTKNDFSSFEDMMSDLLLRSLFTTRTACGN
jgi:hypothetical protein